MKDTDNHVPVRKEDVRIPCEDGIQLGIHSIGHFGYFRKPDGATLWPATLEWLRNHP